MHAAVLDALGLDERLRAAQLVIAGEGCIDEQSFGGKIVGELVRRARAAGVPVCAVAGMSGLPDAEAARGARARPDRLDAGGDQAAGRALGEAAAR